VRGKLEKSEVISQRVRQAMRWVLVVLRGRGEEDAQAFMTRGSLSLSISLVTTAVGKMRGGFGANWLAGRHFWKNCLTIG